MGMYDTFWGSYKCDFCGTIVEFKETTKDYERLLEDFKPGNYVDRGDRNYYYEFKSECPKCHQVHDMSIAIRRGQYVGVFYKYEADNINILDIENIEETYHYINDDVKIDFDVSKDIRYMMDLCEQADRDNNYPMYMNYIEHLLYVICKEACYQGHITKEQWETFKRRYLF